MTDTPPAAPKPKLSLVSPRTPQGVMELLPKQQLAFEHFMGTIRKAYVRYGFLPVETPVFELTNVLLTKNGGETEKQVYFVQSTGALAQGHAPDMALRFDLTVPLARYVAQHENDLNFPFRRYQMQKVYRGERPQKGREREFYQCDIDVIGKDELALGYDAELVAVINDIFTELAIGAFVVQINNRKLLRGLLEGFGLSDAAQQTLALREVDKLDKIGADEVKVRLLAPEIGCTDEQAARLLALVTGPKNNIETLEALNATGITNASFTLGLMELKTVFAAALALGVPEANIRLNLAIVRGLDYYTGTVYETTLLSHPSFGSICSGGRYENLAGLYTKSKLPGVGISIGATRLFTALLEEGLLKASEASTTDVLLLQVEDTMLPEYFRLAGELRQAGLNVEVYVDAHKLGKQLKFADRAGIPYALVLGSDEKSRGVAKVRHMHTSHEEEVPLADLALKLKGLKSI